MTGPCSVLSLCRETSRSYLRFRGRPYQETNLSCARLSCLKARDPDGRLEKWTFGDCNRKSAFGVPAQVVDATQALNLSAGVKGGCARQGHGTAGGDREHGDYRQQLGCRGRISSIVPTWGIVEVVEVVGHGTGVTGTLAVPPRLCAASVAEPPEPAAGSGTPPLRLCAVNGTSRWRAEVAGTRRLGLDRC